MSDMLWQTSNNKRLKFKPYLIYSGVLINKNTTGYNKLRRLFYCVKTIWLHSSRAALNKRRSRSPPPASVSPQPFRALPTLLQSFSLHILLTLQSRTKPLVLVAIVYMYWWRSTEAVATASRPPPARARRSPQRINNRNASQCH